MRLEFTNPLRRRRDVDDGCRRAGLRERGYGHVRDVNGGVSEWARRGWPMVRPAVGPGA